MSAKPHFHVAGIPVRIEPVFWIVTVFLAFNLNDPALIVLWVGVVLVSILVHELGHAVALKAYGQASSIVLHGFGGLTISQRRLSKVQSIVVSLAGPLTALCLLGIPALLIRDSSYGFELELDYFLGGRGFGLWPVLYFAVYVNIWWSIANLLPIRPLDGGNVMTELIGLRKAQVLSVVVGAGAAVWAYFHADEVFRFAAFFAAILAFINFAELRRARMGAAGPSSFDIVGPAVGRGGRRSPVRAVPSSAGPAARPLPGAVEPDAAESFAWNLLRTGDGAGARRVLQRANGPVGPFVAATAEVAAGSGLDSLVAAYVANPAGPSNLVTAAVVADAGAAIDLTQRLVRHGPEGVQAAGSLQTHLHYGERFADAAQVGEVVFSSTGATSAQVAFDVACSWSRAGEPARGLDWLGRAVDLGFSASGVLDGEPDLESARSHPGWAALRGRLA